MLFDSFSGEWVPVRVLRPENLISGRVTDRWGKPITHARVAALGEQVTAASTGSEGKFQLEVPFGGAGSYDLVASHEEYSESNHLRAAMGDSDVNFLLQPLATISGRVISAQDGRPVIEFQIRPERVKDSQDFAEKKPQKVRDEFGRFTLDKVKGGTTGLSVSAKGYAEAVLTIPAVVPGETREEVELRLETGVVLEGRVVDTSGKAIKLAQLYTVKPRRGAVSDSDGAFHFDSLPSGPMEVTVKHEKYAPKPVKITLVRGIVNQTRIVMTEGTVIEGEFTLGGKPVEGDVIITPGIAAPSTMINGVQTISDPAFRLSARAGVDGKYRIVGVPQAPIRLIGTIEPKGCNAVWSKEISIDTENGATHVVDFNFPPAAAHVDGRILIAPQQTLLGTAYLLATYPDFTMNGPTTLIVREDTVSGSYSLCLPSGTTRIRLGVYSGSYHDGPRDKSFTLELTDGDRVTHDILLYGGATLRVSTNIPSASPNNTAVVYQGEHTISDLFEGDSQAAPVVAGQSLDQSGKVTFWGIEPGTYTVVAFTLDDGVMSGFLGSAVITVEKDEEVIVPLVLTEK